MEIKYYQGTLQWRHNDHDGVLKSPAPRLFSQSFIQAQIKENIKAPRHWPSCGETPGPVNSPHKGPVTRKMVPFDDVIMKSVLHTHHTVNDAYLMGTLPSHSNEWSICSSSNALNLNSYRKTNDTPISLQQFNTYHKWSCRTFIKIKSISIRSDAHWMMGTAYLSTRIADSPERCISFALPWGQSRCVIISKLAFTW